MLKDGKLYGSIIPPDVQNLKLKGLKLGEKVDLQILALTDHAVGRDGDKNQENSSSNLKENDPQGCSHCYMWNQNVLGVE